MSAHQGDSSPEMFVFPPFAPPAPRPTPAAAESAPEAEPLAIEVPLPAHDVGDPEDDAPAALPWEAEEDSAPAASEEQDLPWLEVPDGAHRIHSSAEDVPEEVAAAAEAPEAAPSWMAWDTDASSLGETAAEITPPPLAAAGELTSVSAVPSPAADEQVAGIEAFAAEDPYAPTTEAAHPETLPDEAPAEPARSWPVEAMEPAALQAAESAPVVETPVAADAVAVHAPAVDHAEFGRVAERLEAVARALRSDPGGFVASHQDDPLALLIAGFALGYRQAGRTPE